MPKLAVNGFSMFANHCRPKLEAQFGRKLKGMEELIRATTPLWAKLGEEEKRMWKERARLYKKSDEFHERKRAFGRQPKKPKEDAEKAEAANDDDDLSSDDDPGVPMVRHAPLDQPGTSADCS